MTAKAWGARPSSYLPELSTAEAFMFDEACAYVMGVEQQRILDETKAEAESFGGDTSVPGKKFEGLMDPRYMAKT